MTTFVCMINHSVFINYAQARSKCFACYAIDEKGSCSSALVQRLRRVGLKVEVENEGGWVPK